MSEIAYLGLGSNLGDRLGMLRAAVGRIGEVADTSVLGVSSVYETSPVGGPPGQPDYYNLVLAIRTARPPEELLASCLEIELDLGRERVIANGPRTIDIDILLYGGVVLFSETLTVPHPRLHTRAFVLAPLAELAPKLSHPGLGTTVGKLLAGLEEADRASVRRAQGVDCNGLF